VLELVGVSVAGVSRERLNRCAFSLRPGEVLGLVGATGAGKSTALAVLAGQLAPSRGRITLDGRDVTRAPERLRACAGLADERVPGPPEATVEAWLGLWAGLDAVPRAAVGDRVSQARTRFGLAALGERSVASLSRGERNRVRLARLWVRQPRIYLVDAVDDGLDAESERLLAAAVRVAASAGASVVVAASREPMVVALCDRFVGLEGGQATRDVSRAAPDFAAQVAAACRGVAQ